MLFFGNKKKVEDPDIDWVNLSFPWMGTKLNARISDAALEGPLELASGKVFAFLGSLGFPFEEEYFATLVIDPEVEGLSSSPQPWYLSLPESEGADPELYHHLLTWFLRDLPCPAERSLVPCLIAGLPVAATFLEYPDSYSFAWEREFLHTRSTAPYASGTYFALSILRKHKHLFSGFWGRTPEWSWKAAEDLLAPLVDLEAERYTGLLEAFISLVLVDRKGQEWGVYYFPEGMLSPGLIGAREIQGPKGTSLFEGVLETKKRFPVDSPSLAKELAKTPGDGRTLPPARWEAAAKLIASHGRDAGGELPVWEKLGFRYLPL